jgi:predicted permease
MPETLPHWLGRGLYWVGIPLEILALARQTNFSEPAGLAPGITLAAIGIGMAIACLCLFSLLWLTEGMKNAELTGFLSQPWQKPSYQGSFILATALGNTGFVGLSIAPTFIDPEYLSWIVFFSITHNIVGAYGFGVLVASYFGRSEQSHHWWIHLRDVLTVPILWAFAIGYFTQDVELPPVIESGLHGSIDVVIACAFLLIGMRLSQLPGWKSFQQGIIPAVLRVLVVPGLVGMGTTLVLGLSGDRRLAMVLMSGVPTAFAGLIFAEEYELDRTTIASSIILSTILYLLVLPLWLYLFGA